MQIHMCNPLIIIRRSTANASSTEGILLPLKTVRKNMCFFIFFKKKTEILAIMLSD